MGIRGLTAFIEQNSHKYQDNFKLHNTHLIIDGNNLSARLYNLYSNSNDCFGGDYDKYARTIKSFFELLKQCNIDAIVVLDGGLEENKHATIYKRVKERIKSGKRLHCIVQRSVVVHPLFARDLFADILLQLSVKMVRCDNEADLEMVSMARILNCPILSYDSDFYLLDVLYISSKTIDETLQKGSVEHDYIPCQLYRVENLLKAFDGLTKDVLPLLAIVLGNDYINSTDFQAFYRDIKLPDDMNFKNNNQKRIFDVIHWFKTQSYESAVSKILSGVSTKTQQIINNEMKKIVEIYKCESSLYLDLLGIDYNRGNAVDVTLPEIHVQKIEMATEVEDKVGGESRDSNVSLAEGVDVAKDNAESKVAEDTVQIVHCSKESINKHSLPEWFMNKFNQGVFPGWFLDVAVGGLYFLSPQVEDYTNLHSHHASLGLIKALYTMLNHSENKHLVYVARDCDGMKEFNLEIDRESGLPNIQAWPLLTNEESTRILLQDILHLKSVKLDGVPSKWKLIVLSMAYWINTLPRQVKEAHVFALMLTVIVINVVDDRIGYIRELWKLKEKYPKLSEGPPHSTPADHKTADGGGQNSLEETLNNVEINHCLFFMRGCIDWFRMDYHVRTRYKFDVTIVDTFARFQSCLYYIKYLNLVLNCPFDDLIVSDYYNGTLAYNFCANFHKHNDLRNYVKFFMKDSKSIYALFESFTKIVTNHCDGDIFEPRGEKRRRIGNSDSNTFLGSSSADRSKFCGTQC